MDSARADAIPRRLAGALALGAAVAAGLVVHTAMPDTAATDIAGDALYVVAVYAGLVLIVPGVPAWVVGLVAGGWSVAIELFQLTGVPVRLAGEVPLAVLVLGTVFDPRDLAVYVVTAVAVAAVDGVVTRALRGRRPRPRRLPREPGTATMGE